MENSAGNKKKVKGIILIIFIVIIVVGVGVYLLGQSNINYTEEQLEEVALGQIPGQVVDRKTEFEIEDLAFEYNFYIRDENNIMREITVSTKTGASTYIEPIGDD